MKTNHIKKIEVLIFIQRNDKIYPIIYNIEFRTDSNYMEFIWENRIYEDSKLMFITESWIVKFLTKKKYFKVLNIISKFKFKIKIFD